MKKTFLFVLIFSMLSLSGCGTVEKLTELDLPPVPTAEITSESCTSEAVSANRTETEHQHIIVKFDNTKHEAYDPQQGTELILNFSYETPYVHIPANPAAEENINEVIAMLNESFYTGDDYGIVYDSGCAPGYINMLTNAEDNYNFIVNSGAENAYFELANNRSVSVQRCDEHILSLRYYDYINLGGVHGSYAYRSYNFDTTSGELLSLDDLAYDAVLMKAYLASCIVESFKANTELQQQAQAMIELEGMPAVEEALKALVREGAWYLNDRGILFCSDLYEFGPYAAGTIEFFVPYSQLDGYLKTEFIPKASGERGTFTVVPAEKLSESSKEIIDMVGLTEGAQVYYLVVDGSVRNVKLSKVDYADRFYETEAVWQCSVMNNCVIQLVTHIPEGMPELKISYLDADGEHTYYLSESGVDGSVILVDSGIEAVG